MLLHKTRLYVSVAALIAVNIVPIVGVWFWGWEVVTLVFLYWAENLVLGFYNILKLACSRTSIWDKPVEKYIAPIFFLFHYGCFAAFHGACLVTIFHQSLFEIFQAPAVAMTFFLFFISHGASFICHYLPTERNTATAAKLMLGPYGRLAVMQVTVLLGGLVLNLIKSPAALLVLLVVLKTGVDLRAHLLERQEKTEGILWKNCKKLAKKHLPVYTEPE